MGSSGDSSDDHRRPSKNGKEQAQDREILDLKQHVKAWEKEERRVHATIETGIRDIRNEVRGVSGVAQSNRTAVARIEGRQSSNRWLVGLAVTVFGLLLGGIWWGIDQAADAVKTGFDTQEAALETAAEKATTANAKIDAWIKEATRWGNELERADDRANKRIDRNEAQIDRCCKGQRKE